MAKAPKSSLAGLIHSFRKGICAAFPPQGNTIAVGGGVDVVFFDCSTGEEVARTEKTESMKGNIGGIVYSSDGQSIAITHMNGIVSICDAKSGNRLHRLSSTPSDHTGLVTLPTTLELAHGGLETSINFWSWATGLHTRQITASARLRHFTVSPKGDQLIAILNQGKASRLCIWDLATNEVAGMFQVEAKCWKVAISPSGSMLGMTAFNSCYLFNLTTGEQINLCPDCEERVYWSIQFAPDGNHLVTAGLGRVTIWSLTGSFKVLEFATGTGEVLDIVFSPDGQKLAIPAYNKNILFDFEALLNSAMPVPQ